MELSLALVVNPCQVVGNSVSVVGLSLKEPVPICSARTAKGPWKFPGGLCAGLVRPAVRTSASPPTAGHPQPYFVAVKFLFFESRPEPASSTRFWA